MYINIYVYIRIYILWYIYFFVLFFSFSFLNFTVPFNLTFIYGNTEKNILEEDSCSPVSFFNVLRLFFSYIVMF